MNALTRTAVAAVLFLCLASAASAADGVGYGTGTGPDKDTSAARASMHGYKTEQEAAAAVAKWHEEEAENARRIPLTVDECREITKDSTLYEDLPLGKLPPIDQPMPMLSEIFGGMLGMPNLQLVVTEGRKAKNEDAIQTGYPIRWFRMVDIGTPKLYRLPDGKQIVLSLALEAVHKQKATKGFSNDMNAFVYDASGRPLTRVSKAYLPTPFPQKSAADIFILIGSTKGVPLAEGDREYALAQHVLQTAVPTEIPAGK